jgi:ADP-ribose pyrophosphatase YjhB (NUDIX family)
MSLRPALRYCSACAATLVQRVPEGDSRERACCPTCGEIHYVNPRVVVGTVPLWQDKVLLCRRAIEPRLGFWTLPAGFMEVGESTDAGAMRETAEEACAVVTLDGLFSIIDVPSVEQVHLFFRARLLSTDFAPGEESLDVRLFAEDEIPWQEIAFRTVSTTLERFFADRARGSFGLHACSLPPRMAPAAAGG